MSKVQPNGKTRKLTQAEYARLGKLLAGKYRTIKVLENPENGEMLENLLQTSHILTIEKEVSAKMQDIAQRLDCLAVMRDIVSKKTQVEQLQNFTANRLMRDHPNLRDYFLKFMGNAVGYEELMRQLITHHNFESLEPGDINDLIYQVEELRTVFRVMASIEANRYRAPLEESEKPTEGRAA